MATITIDVPNPEAVRIGAALGKVMSLVDGNGAPRSATIPEAKQFVIDTLRGLVRQVESDEQRAAIVVLPMDLT